MWSALITLPNVVAFAVFCYHSAIYCKACTLFIIDRVFVVYVSQLLYFAPK